MAAKEKDKDLNDLFLDTLKDIYFAEKQILKALPKMAKAAKSASKGGIEATANALPQLEKALTDLTKLQDEVKHKVDLGQI